MSKDSLQLHTIIDSTSITKQNINNQFNTTNRIIGSGLVELWFIGLIITVFVFKRPNK